MSKQKIKAKSFVLVGRACTRQARRSVRRIQAEDWLLCDGDDRPLKERDEPDVDEQRQEVEHVRWLDRQHLPRRKWSKLQIKHFLKIGTVGRPA